MKFMKKHKTEESKVEKKPPPSVEELAKLVEKRDRLSAESSEAIRAVQSAIENVSEGTYIAADGGVIRIYQYFDRHSIGWGPGPKVAEFTRPLREIK